ncbi:hypothetical protein CLOM_g320 [Closterium sp. NIES-68]|nr:hypothetical protein CLOM_g320 [Closterium sp. NIES-68]
MVERQQDRLVKAIRTDRGGEFLSKDFSTWLKKQGIRHSLTMPYSPAMNGITEQIASSWRTYRTRSGRRRTKRRLVCGLERGRVPAWSMWSCPWS